MADIPTVQFVEPSTQKENVPKVETNGVPKTKEV